MREVKQVELVDGSCDNCLRRAALLARLAGHIGRARGERAKLAEVLTLSEAELISALGGKWVGELAGWLRSFDPKLARHQAAQASLSTVCCHSDLYPLALKELLDPPAALYIAGSFERFSNSASQPAVAVVGSRKASSYGVEIAMRLGRELASAGVTVVSGMALGVDSAAHSGALDSTGSTLAVLASGADTSYPASKRSLYQRIVARGAAISEFPPGFRPYKWCFPARNRTIAALAQIVIVVEAAERSGSLITAEIGYELGRAVAAVPGRVNSSLAAGPNALIYDGGHVVRDTQDVLDLLFGVGAAPQLAKNRFPEGVESNLQSVVSAIADGHDTLAALIASGQDPEQTMAALAELELLGYISGTVGGRYLVTG